MKVIDERNWVWMLYQDKEQFFFSVMCGSIGLFSREFALNPDEATAYAQCGKETLDILAKEVQNNPANFTHRYIPDFHKNEAVMLAEIAWRRTAKI